MTTTAAKTQAGNGDGKAAALLHRLLDPAGVACEIEMPSGQRLSFGNGPASFRVVFHSTRAFLRGFDEFALARAYIDGDIDIDGDMLTLQWRDYPRQPKFKRSRTDVALLDPVSPQAS